MAPNNGCCPDSSTQTTSRGATLLVNNSRAFSCQSSNDPLNRISMFLPPVPQRLPTALHPRPPPAPQTTPFGPAPPRIPSSVPPNPTRPPLANNLPSSQTPSPSAKTRAASSNPPAASGDTSESTKSSTPSGTQFPEFATTPLVSLD